MPLKLSGSNGLREVFETSLRLGNRLVLLRPKRADGGREAQINSALMNFAETRGVRGQKGGPKWIRHAR
jgi:hypothetical protein